MFAKFAIAALLALTAAQMANAQHLHGNGAEEDQPSQRSTSLNAHPGPAPVARIAGATSSRPFALPPTGASGRVVPAVSTPSSSPTMQQIRR